MGININVCYNTKEGITYFTLFTMGEILEGHPKGTSVFSGCNLTDSSTLNRSDKISAEQKCCINITVV